MRQFGLKSWDRYDSGWEHAADRNGRLPRHRYLGDAAAAERCRMGIDGAGRCGLLLDYAVHDEVRIPVAGSAPTAPR